MPEVNKYEETHALGLFLEARKSATGQHLNLSRSHERPDFICLAPDGIEVGVELTKVAYDFHGIQAKRIFGELFPIDFFALMDAAFASSTVKAEAKRTPGWKYPESTILVLTLVECTFVGSWPKTSEMSNDFAHLGFREIWLADHSSIEAFGAVTAYGIYPETIWGLHGQKYLLGKPFG